MNALVDKNSKIEHFPVITSLYVLKLVWIEASHELLLPVNNKSKDSGHEKLWQKKLVRHTLWSSIIASHIFVYLYILIW